MAEENWEDIANVLLPELLELLELRELLELPKLLEPEKACQA